jgi:PAS domain S-box-containing protein
LGLAPARYVPEDRFMRIRDVSTIPSRDRAFRGAVQRVASDDEGVSAQALRERLRPLYPQVEVFESLLEGEASHLYVYRNGRYVPNVEDRWWEAPGTACVCVSCETGRLTHVSDEWAALMHSSPSELIGRHYTEFVQPEARLAAEAMFEALAQGEVDTQALVRRPDGSTVGIDVHAALGDDEIDVRYRLTPSR